MQGARGAPLLTSPTDSQSLALGALSVCWALCGALVAIGLLTPVVQVVVTIVQLTVLSDQLWAPVLHITMTVAWRPSILETVVAASLALLGPGAYSVDAYLFGRREINIPPVTHRPLV